MDEGKKRGRGDMELSIWKKPLRLSQYFCYSLKILYINTVF